MANASVCHVQEVAILSLRIPVSIESIWLCSCGFTAHIKNEDVEIELQGRILMQFNLLWNLGNLV